MRGNGMCGKGTYTWRARETAGERQETLAALIAESLRHESLRLCRQLLTPRHCKAMRPVAECVVNADGERAARQ